MRLLKELVTTCNIYLSDQRTSTNVLLLQNIASYLTDILRVFGVIPDPTSLGFPVSQSSGDKVCPISLSPSVNTSIISPVQEDNVMPYLTLLADFRAEVRRRALDVKGTSSVY